MKKIAVLITMLMTGIIFAQVKKKDTTITKSKLSSEKSTRDFYKNVDSAKASKYKILTSKPKDPGRYSTLKKKDNTSNRLFVNPKLPPKDSLNKIFEKKQNK